MFHSKSVFLVLLCCVLSLIVPPTLHAQQAPNEWLTKASDLYNGKHYYNTIAFLKKVAIEQPTALAHTNNTKWQQSQKDFYLGASYARLHDSAAITYLSRYAASTTVVPAKQSEAYWLLGLSYQRLGDYKEALRMLHKVEANQLSNADQVSFAFNKAYNLFEIRQYRKSKGLFEKLLAFNDSTYQQASNYYLGAIAFYQEDYKKALLHLKKVEQIEQYTATLPYFLAQIQFQLGQYQDVINIVQPALNNPAVEHQLELTHLIGQSHFALGNYIEAAPFISAYIEQAEKVRSIDMYQLAFIQYQQGEYTDAIESFKSLNLLNDSLGQNGLYCLADCYLKTNQLEAARNAYEEVINMKTKNQLTEIASFYKAKLSYHLQYDEVALSELQKFITNYTSSKYNDEAKALLSNALISANNYSQALKIIESIDRKTVPLKSAYQRAAILKANELYSDKNYKQALEYTNKALRYPISSALEANSYFLKGEILYALEEYSQTQKPYLSYLKLVKALKLSRKNEQELANYNIAYSYFKTKQISEALTYFVKVTDKLKNSRQQEQQKLYQDALLRKADCGFLLKQYALAGKTYQTIIKKDYAHADYATYQIAIIEGLQANYYLKQRILEKMLNSYKTSSYIDDALFELGNVQLELDNQQAAITAFNTLIAQYTNSPFYLKSKIKLALAYFQ